jgi:AcrB/AcrD/AcrF family
VPLVIAGNIPGQEIEHPMAVVILGGIITSTLLNLFIIPVLYSRLRSRPEELSDSELWGFRGAGHGSASASEHSRAG